MKLSVIISYYKNLPFLDLILQDLAKQTYQNFEVIVAEDDDREETKSFIKKVKFPLSLKHVYHEDIGFRKCAILNKAIKAAEGEYLIFLDGDCIPHPKLVETYKKFAHLGVCYGRRVLLCEKFTNKCVADKSFSQSFINILFSKNKKVRHSLYLPFRKPTIETNKGIWGCNWGAPKAVIESVNGFDEDYVSAGIGEDVDIEWRLNNKGYKRYYLKHLAIVYHLFHKPQYDQSSIEKNIVLLNAKKQANLSYCVNGIEKVVSG